MKKIFLSLFVSLLMASVLTGQENPGPLQNHPAGRTPKTGYKLFEADIMLEDSTLTFSWDEKDNEWITQTATRTTSNYDDKRRLTKKSRYCYDPLQKQLNICEAFLYTYDTNNNLIFSSQETVNIYGFQSTEMKCDSMQYKGNILVSHKSYILNPINRSWCLESQKQYNASGSLISSFSQQFGHFSRPEEFKACDGNKSEFKLNPAGLVVEISYQRYERKTETWQKSNKFLFSYRNNKSLTSRTYYSWDTITASWQAESRLLFSCSGSNCQTIIQSWVGNSWKNKNRTSYILNHNKNVTDVKYSDWNGKTWIESHKHQFKYDINNQLTEESDYLHIPDFWLSMPNNAYRYDERGNLIMRTYTPYDLSSDKLQFGMKYTYEYDSSGMLSQSVYHHWDTKLQEFVPQVKTCHYYSKHEQAPTNKDISPEPIIYTGPVTDKLYFENIQPNSSALVYDIDGFLKINSPIINNQIDVGDLWVGQYNIQIVSKKGITRSKFVCNLSNTGYHKKKVYTR